MSGAAARLADLTSPEAGEAIASADLAVLPVGSTEQHGPHMAVSTDARIAELGDPCRADRELGERIVAVALSRATSFARTFAATPEEDRSR